MPRLSDKSWTFQCVAHRGFRAHYAENTLMAFEKALEVGATMLELDVRLTKDDIVVILHDPTLLRLGNDRRHVSSISWEELKELDIHDKKARHYKSGSVLSLERLFQAMGNKVNYYIEIKKSKRHSFSHAQKLCDRTIDMVRKYGLETHVMYVSFDLAILEHYHSCCDVARLGLNFKHSVPEEQTLKQLKDWNAILCPKWKLLTEENFSYWKKLGFRIVPWVINKPEMMKYFKEMGVDGITTDNPELLLLS